MNALKNEKKEEIKEPTKCKTQESETWDENIKKEELEEAISKIKTARTSWYNNLDPEEKQQNNLFRFSNI